MTEVKLIQKELEMLVKVYISPTPVDIGNFSVFVIHDDVSRIGKELNIKFDRVRIFPGPQPRKSGDVEFFLNGKIIKKISVKTAVTGNIKLTLKKLWKDMRNKKQDGIILTVYLCKKIRKEKEEDSASIVLIYLPYACNDYLLKDVYDTIIKKLKEKGEQENCDVFRPLAINDAVLFEHLKIAVITSNRVDKLEMRVNSLDRGLADLSERTSRLESGVADLNERMKNVEGSIEELKESNEAIKKRIDRILEVLEGSRGK